MVIKNTTASFIRADAYINTERLKYIKMLIVIL